MLPIGYYGGNPLGQNYTLPPGFGVDPTTTGPGPQRYGQGSSATGFIPAPPSLQQTSADSIGINLANMAALKQLYDQTANQYVPGYSGLSQQESQNIGELLHPTDFRDSLRHAAEIGTHAGVTGAPINDAYSAFATHDQKLRDWSLGSQMLGGAATRGKGIMPFEQFFVNPQQAYEADWLAKQLQAAPNPAEAYNLNMQNAALGLRQGQRAGYGAGGGNPLGGYGGNMITGTPNRVDQVVNKYSRTLNPNGGGPGPMPPSPSGGGSWSPNAPIIPDWAVGIDPDTGQPIPYDNNLDISDPNQGIYSGTNYNLNPGNEYDWTA